MAVKIGVKDLYAFELDAETDVSGATAPTYGTPFRIAKAINIGLTPQKAEASLYADDGLDEYISSTTAYDISINTNTLEPAIEAQLLGKKVDSNGGISTTTEDVAPLFAVAFRSLRSDGSYEFRVVYKVRFSAFDESYNTKGENIEFQTPTFTGRASARDYDGRYDFKLIGTAANKTVTDAWFTTVQEPDFTTGV